MFDAEARGTPEGIVKIPRLGSEIEKKTSACSLLLLLLFQILSPMVIL